MKKETTIGKIVTSEIAGKVILYDIELREKIKFGEGKRTLRLSLADNDKGWGHVYVDLDKDDMPLAVTLIVNKDRKADNAKN